MCTHTHTHTHTRNISTGPQFALHINYKEVCTVASAVDKWAQMLRGKTIVIHTGKYVTKCVSLQ